MDRKLVTCPEIGHLEEVVLEPTPAGSIVIGCSRFGVDCAVDCPRTCAQRMDRRARLVAGARERVLVLFAAEHAATRLVAEVLADHLMLDGVLVELVDVECGALPAATGHDAVVVVSPLRNGRHSHALVEYVHEHRDTLTAMPAFLVVVLSVSGANESRYELARLSKLTGWYPTDALAVTTVPRWIDVRDFAFRISEQIPAAAGVGDSR